MTKNIGALAVLAEKGIRKNLKKEFDKVKNSLNLLEIDDTRDDCFLMGSIEELEGNIASFQKKMNYYSEVYGLEFPEMKEDYSKLSDRIQEYIPKH